MSTQTIERTTLTHLIHNENYCRKVIPFIKSDYFSNRDEKIVFEEIEKFLEKYNSLPTQEALSINVDNRKDLTDDEYQLQYDIDNLYNEGVIFTYTYLTENGCENLNELEDWAEEYQENQK